MITQNEEPANKWTCPPLWLAIRAYQVLFVYYCRSNLHLNEQLNASMANGQPISDELLEGLSGAFMSTNERLAEMEIVSSEADALTKVAHDLAEKVASSQSGLHSYGSSLAHWAGRMNADATPESLIQAVAALAAETARASERNRELERELSAKRTGRNRVCIASTC